MNSVVLCAISVSLCWIFSEQFHHRGTETAQSFTEKILFPTDSKKGRKAIGPISVSGCGLFLRFPTGAQASSLAAVATDTVALQSMQSKRARFLRASPLHRSGKLGQRESFASQLPE